MQTVLSPVADFSLALSLCFLAFWIFLARSGSTRVRVEARRLGQRSFLGRTSRTELRAAAGRWLLVWIFGGSLLFAFTAWPGPDAGADRFAGGMLGFLCGWISVLLAYRGER